MTVPQGFPGSQPHPHLAEVGNLPPVDIDQMRRDLRLTADREGWSDAEVKELGAAIRAAIEAGDQEVLRYWAGRLAWWRELLASYAPRLRAFETAVRSSADPQHRRAA